MASVSSSKDTNDHHILKQKAMRYYQENGVPEKMEQILNSMFHEDPPDVYGHLVNFFDQFTKPPTLERVTATEILDCLGQTTLQTNVYCTVRNETKLACSLGIPNANLKVKPEEREKAELDLYESVKNAIEIINEELSLSFNGMDPSNQSQVDKLVTEVIEKKKALDLEKKAKEAESKEDQLPAQPPPADDKDKKKSAKKGGKSSHSIDFVPEREPEYLPSGSEAITAISQAVCACAAAVTYVPVYRHIANVGRIAGAVNEFRIPLPMITIVQSGKLGTGKVNCIKDYMVVPGPQLTIDKSIVHIKNIYSYVARSLTSKLGVSAKFVNEIGALCPPVDVPTQMLDLLQEAVNAQGLTIGEDVFLAVDAAAHECFDYDKGKYEIVLGTFKSPDEMVEFWADILHKYPSICALIDPLRAEDSDAWLKLAEKVSKNVYIVGSHYYERPALLTASKHLDPSLTSGIVLNLERMTSVSDVIQCANTFQSAKNEIIIATNEADTSDTFVVDLAVGLNARFFKIGGPCRGERATKLNRLLQIFSELEPALPVIEGDESREESDTKLQEEEERDDSWEENKFLKQEKQEEKLFGQNECSRLLPHTPFTFHVIEKRILLSLELENVVERDRLNSIQSVKK